MQEIADAATPRLARGVRLQIDGTTGKGVLLFPEGVLELNETAHDIIARCNGQSLSEIIRELSLEYDVDPATLATDVRETLRDLHDRKLVKLE